MQDLTLCLAQLSDARTAGRSSASGWQASWEFAEGSAELAKVLGVVADYM